MPPKKQSIGTSKNWKTMPIPSNQKPRQDTRRVYAGDAGTRSGSRRGEDPSLQAGKGRTMRPAERERENEAAMSARGGKPDGRSPVRGQGVFDSSFENRPPASQTREPTRRPQRRRGDGSLAPVDADE
jgi:hypothetical protein